MYRIDLHSHSIVSHDGGISTEQYKQLLAAKVVDFIAVTDHNLIHRALELRKQLGPAIIVGEEILTTDGEIIGLFLNKEIPAGLSAVETISQIRSQKGLVYIPHPFEKNRHSISEEVLKNIKDQVDIIEVFNARGRFRDQSSLARKYSEDILAGASSSDAHGIHGVGSAYSIVPEAPTAENLTAQLQKASLIEKYAPFWTYAYPTINRIKKYVA